MKRVIVGVTLACAAVIGPSASAKSPVRVSLPLVPLQSARLGAIASSLPLEHDSGVVSNAVAAAEANGNPTLQQFAHLRRITGYRLDYGNRFLPGTGVREIETGVERYKTETAAKHALAFWRNDARKGMPAPELGQPSLLGVSVSVAKIRTAAVGSAHWALASTLRIADTSPVYSLREEAQDRNYIVAIVVAAGSLSPAKQLVPKLAKAVDSRLRLALAGKLHGAPAKLPGKVTPGPPSSGPDPSKAALAPSDFAQATLSSENYSANPSALSEYDATFATTDDFDTGLRQQIVAESTPSEATYLAALTICQTRGLGAEFKNITPVDLSSIGDDAYGALLEHQSSGIPVYNAWVVLANGPMFEVLYGSSSTPLPKSDVTKLAQAAADKLDAAVAG